MIALDTNVIVRVVTRDDPQQVPAAVAVMRSGDLWVSKTVLLETERVLRYSYKLNPAAIAEAFRKLLGYRPLQVEDRGTVLRALAWFQKGLDFADALQLGLEP
jgi:predicted nucleic-acid-binding protein